MDVYFLFFLNQVDVYFVLTELCISNSSIGQHLMLTKKDREQYYF